MCNPNCNPRPKCVTLAVFQENSKIAKNSKFENRQKKGSKFEIAKKKFEIRNRQKKFEIRNSKFEIAKKSSKIAKKSSKIAKKFENRKIAKTLTEFKPG